MDVGYFHVPNLLIGEFSWMPAMREMKSKNTGQHCWLLTSN